MSKNEDNFIALHDLQRQIQDLMPHNDTDIADDENLLEQGLDSINIMQLVSRWRSIGNKITFSQLLEKPTISAWHQLLSQKSN